MIRAQISTNLITSMITKLACTAMTIHLMHQHHSMFECVYVCVSLYERGLDDRYPSCTQSKLDMHVHQTIPMKGDHSVILRTTIMHDRIERLQNSRDQIKLRFSYLKRTGRTRDICNLSTTHKPLIYKYGRKCESKCKTSNFQAKSSHQIPDKY